MPETTRFSFEISLSVLNHLGRNLYRSFATVLGEAISNSWDADAKNVWIHVNRPKNSFLIMDDGIGMTEDDFQNKFLKIGYTKRKGGKKKSAKERPFIGRKGIGKLALLSCAEKIHIISKTEGGVYVGGVIDNTGLDTAITEDLKPEQYPLEAWDDAVFAPYMADHQHGTIIYFEKIKDGIRNSLDFLKKIIALYFRFSLLDDEFNIFVGKDKVGYDSLDDLMSKTEFLWLINGYTDPYIKNLEGRFTAERNEKRTFTLDTKIKGFVASVEKPRDLKILTTEERVGVDLFVNGRLRERDILKHIPTSRIAENYIYGQIHFDELDDDEDRFTSSREGVVADDPKYMTFLEALRQNVILKIIEDWDEWRLKHRQGGDPENDKVSRKKRSSLGLFDAVSGDYVPPESSVKKKEVDGWVDELREDAAFNFESYAECFVSENLTRRYIVEKKIALSKEATVEAEKWKRVETDSKNRGNVSIDIRRIKSDLSYLSMNDLAYMVDKPKDKIKDASLARDADEYRPMRDAVAHTSLLTDDAKRKLTTVYENIKARILMLFS